MLHVKKVLCLVLAAAVSSVAVGGALFWAQKNYKKAITEAKTFVISKCESMTQDLESVSGRISSRLAQLQHRHNHTIRESQRRYDTWKVAMSDELLAILDEALGHFNNMRDEVETYVAMYKQNRIPEDEALRFIKEDELQLPKFVISAISRFNGVGRMINNGPDI